jgi:hypothetical protein
MKKSKNCKEIKDIRVFCAVRDLGRYRRCKYNGDKGIAVAFGIPSCPGSKKREFNNNFIYKGIFLYVYLKC